LARGQVLDHVRLAVGLVGVAGPRWGLARSARGDQLGTLRPGVLQPAAISAGVLRLAS
jgi:hypothetical protein